MRQKLIAAVALNLHTAFASLRTQALGSHEWLKNAHAGITYPAHRTESDVQTDTYAGIQTKTHEKEKKYSRETVPIIIGSFLLFFVPITALPARPFPAVCRSLASRPECLKHVRRSEPLNGSENRRKL
jgi:hypothetical protein